MLDNWRLFIFNLSMRVSISLWKIGACGACPIMLILNGYAKEMRKGRSQCDPNNFGLFRVHVCCRCDKRKSINLLNCFTIKQLHLFFSRNETTHTCPIKCHVDSPVVLFIQINETYCANISYCPKTNIYKDERMYI